MPESLKRVALPYLGSYDPLCQVLRCGHNAGFFSNCTVTLWHLAQLQRDRNELPAQVDFSAAFSAYRNPAQQHNSIDLYPLFFACKDDAAPITAPIPTVKHHGLYRFLDHARLAPVLQRYFHPSAAALEIERHLLSKYRIDLHKTIAVVYRGTDKGIEVRLADPQAYLRATQALLARHPDHRVLIQTDEWAVRQLFLQTFGERCFALEEMPVSQDGVVVHDLDDQALRMDRSQFGVLLVAVTHLLAQAAYVVNHTGNMALWIALYRGHAQGMVQFDEGGVQVRPYHPAYWVSRATHLARKVSRRLGLRLVPA